MIDNEETREWRKPTDEELEVVRRNTKIFAEYYMGMAKSVGICVAIALGVMAYCVYFLIRYGGTEALAAVIVLAVIDLCFLISILRKRSKARFVLKSSNEGTVWVRDVVVVDKQCFTSRRNQYNETYYIDAHIDNFNGSYEDSNRSYSVSAYIYSILHKGDRFIDVRYDPELDGEPYLIIEHLWSACI